MDNNEKVTEVLLEAIRLEEESREFYLKAAKKTESEYGKRVYEALADDETRHIVVIREYCEHIAKKKSSPKLCAIMPQHKEIRERILMAGSESEKMMDTAAGADQLAAYEIAMKMENKGYALYKRSHDAAQDQDVKELYIFLMKEEEAHYELLSSTYEYLKDPAAWFARQEKPIVEG